MKKLIWHLNQILTQLGFLGCIGLLLVLLAGFTSLKTNNNREKIAQLKMEINRLKTQPEGIERHPTANSIEIFNQWFPARNEVSQQLRILHQLASKQHLSIDEADYRLSPITGSQLWRYQVMFPLEADYKTIRRFMSALLQALPNASLENIELSRVNAKTSNLNANLNLILYYREVP